MYRRIFAWILTLAMVFSLLPSAALAVGEVPETEPVVTEPTATEPEVTKPAATEPQTTEPEVTVPVVTEPQATEPKATEPVATEPKATEPKATEPAATEPKATEPKATEPQATEPAATEQQATQPAATEPAPDKKVKFTSPGKRDVEKTLITVHLDFEFPEGSGLSAEDIYDVNVYLDRATEEDWESYDNKYVSAENGWTATFELEEGGTYSVSFGDAGIDGYVYGIEGVESFDVATGQTVAYSYKAKYTKDEATVIVNLDFAEDSALSSSEVGDITVTLDSWDWDESVSAVLSHENGRTAAVTVPSGWYTLSFDGHRVEDLLCTIDDGSDPDATEPGWGISAGATATRNCKIRYVKNEAKLTISLPIGEDSELTDAQVGDIYVTAFNSDTGDSYTGTLSSANNRTVEFTVTPGCYDLTFSGYEVEDYLCNLENYCSVDLNTGDNKTHQQTITYTRNESRVKVVLTFADDSTLKNADVGTVTATLREKYSPFKKHTVEMTASGENSRVAEWTVAPGEYHLDFAGWEMEDYVCRIVSGQEYNLKAGDTEINRTISYVQGESLLSICLAIADDSLVSDDELGDIQVTVKERASSIELDPMWLTKANGRKLELLLPIGEYEVKFDLPEVEGLYHESLDGTYTLRAGKETSVSKTIRYVENKGEVSVYCAAYHGEREPFDFADFGNMRVTFTNALETQTAITETLDGLGNANVSLAPGEYTVTLSGYEVEGYTCSIVNGTEKVTVRAGQNSGASFDLWYEQIKNDLTISLVLGEDSEITDVDFENISVTLRDSWDDAEVIETKNLNSDGKTEFTLPTGTYYVTFSGYKMDGYYFRIEGAEEIEVPLEEDVSEEYTVSYVKEEATLTVSLDFAEDSALDGDDIEELTAEIYNFDSEALAGTVVLTKENGWKGQFTVPARAPYYDDVSDDVEPGISYELRISGAEQTGYRYLLAGADYILEPNPGAEDGWNVIAKYVKAEHKVTVNVRLSEDSEMPAAELKNVFNLTLEEINSGIVDDGAIHPGSTVFTHTFTDLPASDCYRLSVGYYPYADSSKDEFYDVTVQSITCTGEELYKDLEEGQLDFTLESDCEIEVVVRGKDYAGGEMTVIARFTEDSALQAKDFPEGIKLVTTYRPTGLGPGTYEVRVGENVFSPDSNWTKKITVPGLATRLKLEDHPEGYFGTVTLSGVPDGNDWVDSSDCPTTVYADICFAEYQPYYLDVQIVFTEDSALNGAEAGSFFLDINDSGKTSSHEFKEGSWHQTIELHGNTNAIMSEACSLFLGGLARAGYTYTAAHVGDEYEYGDGFYEDNYWEGNVAIPMWDRGETMYVVFEVCYTPAPGKLVVDIVSSPYGTACDTTITVKDAKGDVVAEQDAQAVNVGEPDEEDPAYGEVHTGRYQCILELPETGTYTISQTVEEDTDEYTYYADGDKTIEFDPAKGAAITLINERRARANLQLRKRFDKNSELGPEDFPDGITVKVTEESGAFSGEYVLSDANGWSVDLRVPDGIYTVTETNADKDGYTRNTQYVFTQTFAYGSESLRGWGLRNSAPESRETTTTDTVGGPYYIYQEGWDQHKVTIHNSYVSIEEEPDVPTGSIIINAGDGFYDFDSGDELTEKPDTGSEAESYTYKVTVDGEEQTVTLKPGETFELDGLEEGTEYTVTPVLPDGYPWNADVTPITGTIGGGDEDSWNAEVSFENDYYYTYEDGTLTVVKTDALTEEKLKGAKFGLYADKDCTDLIAKATTNKDGICSFTLTEEGTYYLKELKAPEDYYEKSEEVKTVTVTAEWKLETREGTKVLVQKLTASVAGLPQKDGGYIWENERKTTDISVTKKFLYDEDLERPDSVTIVLYQDGEAYETVKLSEANDWTYVWEDMPLGFEYAVDELNVAKGYYKQIRSDGYDFTVVNSGSWIPQTGDESQIMFWCAGAMLSLCAIVFLTEKKRRQRI